MRDPADSRMAIAMGFLLLALILGCCGITIVGWVLGGMNVMM